MAENSRINNWTVSGTIEDDVDDRVDAVIDTRKKGLLLITTPALISLRFRNVKEVSGPH